MHGEEVDGVETDVGLAVEVAVGLVGVVHDVDAEVLVVPVAAVCSTDLFSSCLVVGTGATVVNGTKATVTYTGWLYDTGKANGKGNQFDTGSFSFVVGAGAVVKGFDQALVGMKVGGQRRVIIPPELAYGATSPSAAIPANATLVFEITLTSVS